MKLCITGTRGHNGYVFKDLAELANLELAGISAGCPEDSLDGLRRQCARAGLSPAEYGDYRAMLDQVQPDIVSVAGPNELHAEMSAEAMKRGAAVFCEKPVATELDGLERLEQEHKRSGVHFAAMMGLRYHPAFLSAWRCVNSGEIGEVRLVSARKSYKLGKRPAWYGNRETYGGTIPWVGSHAIDWIYWFGGSFRSVYARHSRRGNRGNGDLEMSAVCAFELESEAFGAAEIDYFRPDGATGHGDDRVRVVGTDGVVEVMKGKAYLAGAKSGEEKEIPPAKGPGIFQDFVENVGGGGGLIGPADTFAVTRACLLARQSADEKREIHFGQSDTYNRKGQSGSALKGPWSGSGP
ncbi:MAG: Gfo/Idh/MocA family oxidoreductase [Kiritimatiellia bacterium]